MSISSALSNALTGLNAASRRTEVISDNVANALTPGYARRRLEVSPLSNAGQGSGVAVVEVVRSTDPRATSERRRAEAEEGRTQTLSTAEGRLAGIVGGIDDPGSLPAAAVAFESALVRLADTPESGALQAEAVGRARALAATLANASDATQRVRMDADAAIGRMVATTNDALKQIEDINADIRRATIAGQGTATMEEDRQRQIDRLTEILPVRLAPRDNGTVAIYTPGGAILLDGPAAKLEFSTTAHIEPASTLALGGLQGLSIDGRPVDGGMGGPLDGGALAAQFDVRDRHAPAASAQLDAMAEDLVRRFQDPAMDATLAPGAPGLFTDQGGALDPLDLMGLAGRLRINAAVDPQQPGGQPWRMRDGIGAAAEGPVGLDTLPRAMIAALSRREPVPAGAGFPGEYGFADFAESVSAHRAQAEAESAAAATFQTGRRTTLAEAEAAVTGVDSDHEMADLLLAEQAYAANARVLATADRLLQRLLEI